MPLRCGVLGNTGRLRFDCKHMANCGHKSYYFCRFYCRDRPACKFFRTGRVQTAYADVSKCFLCGKSRGSPRELSWHTVIDILIMGKRYTLTVCPQCRKLPLEKVFEKLMDVAREKALHELKGRCIRP